MAAAGTVLAFKSLFSPLWQRVPTWKSDLHGFVQQVGDIWLVVLDP